MNSPASPQPDGIERKTKPVLRQCVACRKMFPRASLLRLVYDRRQARIFLVQPLQSHRVTSGRSAYLCLSEECLRIALKGKKIQKALKTAIPDDILECLNVLLKGHPPSGKP